MHLARQATSPSFGPVSNANHGSRILAVTGSFTAFASAVVLARLYVRSVMLKTIGIDNWIMIVSMVRLLFILFTELTFSYGCSVGVFACFVEEVKLGVGEHFGNPELMENYERILHWTYYHGWLIVLGICSVKISVGFFLLRLVQGKWYKRFIITWISFLTVFMLACIGTLVFQCLPVNAAWSFALRANPTTKCYSIKTFRAIGLFNGSINIFTDFVFATLLIPVILPLQINMRTKISLLCILTLGYFACAASIVKEVLLSTFFNNEDIFFNDAYQIWNNVELNTGILAACLPALRPLFNWLLETAAALKTSGLRSRTGPNGTKHRYYIQEDDIKLGSMPSRSTLTKHSYGVTVSNISGGKMGSYDDKRTLYAQGSAKGSGPMSKLEESIGENDSGSDKNILPVQQTRVYLPRDRENRRGIVRTTEVMISR